MSALLTSHQLLRRLIWAGVALVFVLVFGSTGYWFIASGRSSLVDCVYMTLITITTIGYGEIIDLSSNPSGRIFTMLIALSGIGTLTYLLSNVTAFIIEGDFSESFRRRKMEKTAGRMKGHYLVCGIGKVGFHIVKELFVTRRQCVVIDDNPASLEHIAKTFDTIVYFQADPSDNDALLSAGIRDAEGLFAATDDDTRNLVIALTAKQLNPHIRVIARCQDLKNMEKIQAAGADKVISPTFIGGLRMTSEMIRPTVVSFLDTMLRDQHSNLRVEEIPVSVSGKKVADLGLSQFPNTLLLAVRLTTGWVYNPKPDYTVEGGSHLIVMTTPEERIRLEQHIEALRS